MANPYKASQNYHDEVMKTNIVRLREVLDELPPFMKQYFRGIEEYTASRTRLSYAYDIRLFFEFLHETNPALKNTEIKDFPLSVLDSVRREDIEEYLYTNIFILRSLSRQTHRAW